MVYKISRRSIDSLEILNIFSLFTFRQSMCYELLQILNQTIFYTTQKRNF